MKNSEYKIQYIPYEKMTLNLNMKKFDVYIKLKDIIETNFRRKNILLIDNSPREKNFYGSVTPDSFDALPHIGRRNPRTEVEGTIKQKEGYTEVRITHKYSEGFITFMVIWLAGALFGATMGIIGEFIKGNYFYPIFFLLIPILPYLIFMYQYNMFSRSFKNDLYTLFEDDII